MANKQARYLRQHMTRQEVKLRLQLRTWRSDGFHFRRQAPREGLILDFVCLKQRSVIELDGGGHALHLRRFTDRMTDRRLEDRGFRVVRFWIDEIDHNLHGVRGVIRAAGEEPPTPRLRRDPPLLGEG